jgi:hypothetical protein
MINDSLKVTGDLVVEITGPDGKLKDRREVKNVVVTVGKTFIASSMLKTTSNVPIAMTHMAIGSGATAAVVADSVLGAELGRSTLSSATSTGAVVTYVASFAATVGTGAITEAGIFNAASAGTMLCRTVFSVVNKGADDSMSITWAITVS